jgi:beta-1,2-mannosidase
MKSIFMKLIAARYRTAVACGILNFCVLFLSPSHAGAADATGWTLGPFTRSADAQPIIKPDLEAVFNCPMRQMPVHWEATHTFNPAAIVKDGKVYVIYRAEDNNGGGIGGYTSRLGLASSDDGIHFTQMPSPVLYPNHDDQTDREWIGGCEDPRCVETEDGTYVLFYTQYHQGSKDKPRTTDLGMATSRDLLHWTKCGPVQGPDASGKMVRPSKSASLVCSVRNGRVIATRIKGKYWLYYGEGVIHLMTSDNLHDWTPVPKFAMAQRKNLFDSGLAECGPPALLTDKGIVLLYNGKNAGPGSGDPTLKTGVYADGQALFDAQDPTHLLARLDHPFFQPELPWEKTGQYGAGTTFIEGLVLFKNKWLLYYGCADTFVGVAIADVTPGETAAPALVSTSFSPICACAPISF